MKMELNSASSLEASSTWAAALPRLTARRGALVDPSAEMRQRRYSSSGRASFYVFSSLVRLQATNDD